MYSIDNRKMFNSNIPKPNAISQNRKQNNSMLSKNKLLKDSFYMTYVLLLTTGTICFIEAVRTPDIKIRNILNLEVCISVIAAYFYSIFVGVHFTEIVFLYEINGRTVSFF